MRATLLLLAGLLTALLLAPAATAQTEVLPVSPYHNYATMEQDLRALADAHPDLVRVSVLGQSTNGLALWRVDVADMTDEHWADLPVLLVDGGRHGNELLGMEAAYYFLESLVDAASADPSVLEGKRVVVVPTANPDGLVKDHRTNANWVDLNRNFPWMWNERGTSTYEEMMTQQSYTYAGPSAGSEVETKLVMDLMAEGDVRGYVTFHTGTFDVVLPWSPEQDAPIPDWALYETVLGMVKAQTGLEYRDPGATGESHAHAYGNLGIFGILPEVSEEQDALYTEDDVRERVKEGVAIAHLWLTHLLDLGGRLEVVTATGSTVTLRNVGLGAAYAVTTDAAALDALAPGEEATLAIDDCGVVDYLRLNLPDIERLPTGRLLIAETTDCVDAVNETPAGGVGLAVAALAAVALSLRRRV